MTRNVIGNISELVESIDLLGQGGRSSLEEIIGDISNVLPRDTLFVSIGRGDGELIFDFQKRTPEGICVYHYSNFIS